MAKNILTAFMLMMLALGAEAQSLNAEVTLIDYESKSELVLVPGDNTTQPAPLDINMRAITDGGERYTAHTCEWKLFRTNEGENNPVFVRYDDETSFTLTDAGAYQIVLYCSYFGTREDGTPDTIEYKIEQNISITISESELSCPDGFSPNDDGYNDVLHIKYKSIIKLDASIFNRWGQKLYTMNLDNVDDGWDGTFGGKTINDGVYYINIQATGSDGVKYSIKKAINVLTRYTNPNDTPQGQ